MKIAKQVLDNCCLITPTALWPAPSWPGARYLQIKKDKSLSIQEVDRWMTFRTPAIAVDGAAIFVDQPAPGEDKA